MKIQWVGIHKNEIIGIRAMANGENIMKAEKEAAELDFYRRTSSFYFVRRFNTVKEIAKAEINTVGLGFYELYINGERVGRKVLTPFTSDYAKKILYNSYDITGLLLSGENAVAYHLGGGWFTPDTEFCDWRFCWYGSPRLFMELTVTYVDGTTEVINSDENFYYHEGPVVKSSIYKGEIYDVTKEIEGWNTNGCDISGWNKAEFVEAPGGELKADDTPDIRPIRSASPVAEYKISRNTTVYAFEENLTGLESVTVRGRAGDVIEIITAENINPDHTPDTETNRMEICDRYTLKGEGEETYCPHFTWHGFQYISVTVPDSVEIISVSQIHVRSDLELCGSFSCDNEVINTLHEKFMRSQLNCLMGVPVDCSQRCERLGWLGDAYVTSLTCLYNLETKNFYGNYLEDIRLTQNNEGNIAHIAPWYFMEGNPVPFDWTFCYPELINNYTAMTGDTEFVKLHYDSLYKFWLFNKNARSDGNYTRPKYGDWMSTAEGHVRGDPVCLNTMLFCLFCDIMKTNAIITGNKKHIKGFESARKESKNAILNEYYDSENKHFIPDTQCVNAVGLFAGLCPEEDNEAVLKHIIDLIKVNSGCLNTGIIGTYYLLRLFEKYDRVDEIYKLMMQTDFPSWRNLLEGRSTLPEKWTGLGSGCHAMFDMADAHFYSSLAGIRINYLNKNHIEIRPWISNELAHISATHKDISVELSRDKNIYTVEISVPEEAMFSPVCDMKISRIEKDGAAAEGKSFAVETGKHTIKIYTEA